MKTQDEILAALAAKKISVEEASKLIDALKPKQSAGRLYCKVSPKGAVSVYGLQRMPVTLYVEQWERLLEGCPEDHMVLAFAHKHESEEFHGESEYDAKGTKLAKKTPYTARVVRKAA